ncbi:VOC family protein [Sphingomonas sp. GCM10030256]|uniref:VOC family protein n=1 Tax=Sphingomonas sp. GCM10030256 TaxID=3273427 RepID=UPI0036130509
MKVKGLSWVGVGTDDYPRTLSFFTQTLGLEIEVESDHQAILRVAPGQQLEIFGRDGRGKTLNAVPTIAFEVDDVPEAATALTAGGAELVGDIGSWNGHEWLYFRTPDGHLFEVKSSPGYGELS